MAAPQKSRCHSTGVSAPSETNQAGSDAVLGGFSFDPFDIPFLPLWPEVPAVFPRFESNRGAVAACAQKVSIRSVK